MDKKCFECGKPATEDHHVIPQSLGGVQTVPLCGCCHDRVHEGGWRRRDNHIELTKLGLQRAKERGVTLGNPTNLSDAGKKGAETTKKKADEFVQNIKDVVLAILEEAGTYYKASLLLNERAIPTARNGKWSVQSVCNFLQRLRAIEEEAKVC